MGMMLAMLGMLSAWPALLSPREPAPQRLSQHPAPNQPTPTTPPNHPTTQPPNHPTTQPPNHPTTQPPNHPTTQPPNHPTTQPPNHPTTPPPHHPTTPPPNHPTPPPRGEGGWGGRGIHGLEHIWGGSSTRTMFMIVSGAFVGRTTGKQRAFPTTTKGIRPHNPCDTSRSCKLCRFKRVGRDIKLALGYMGLYRNCL